MQGYYHIRMQKCTCLWHIYIYIHTHVYHVELAKHTCVYTYIMCVYIHVSRTTEEKEESDRGSRFRL